MKRISLILILFIFFSNLVFAEDYVVGDPENKPEELETSLEIAQLRSDIGILNNKIDESIKITADLVKNSDVNVVKDEFFMQARDEMNRFSAILLIGFGVYTVFLTALIFLMKAKKWI